MTTLRLLRVLERIEYKIALLTFRVFHGSAPPYLASLRFTGINRLLVPPFKRSTASSRAFSVAKSLTQRPVTSSQSEYTFRCQFKTWLFKKCLPYIIMVILTAFDCNFNMLVSSCLFQLFDGSSV